jgi:hypothetical protein
VPMMVAPVDAPATPTATVSTRRRETLLDSVIVRCPSHFLNVQVDYGNFRASLS